MVFKKNYLDLANMLEFLNLGWLTFPFILFIDFLQFKRFISSAKWWSEQWIIIISNYKLMEILE